MLGSPARHAVTLFRAVSIDEAKSIMDTKEFALRAGQTEVKYFAMSLEDAMVWGQDLYGRHGEAFEVVLVTIDRSPAEQLEQYEIDRRMAIVVYGEQLADFNSA